MWHVALGSEALAIRTTTNESATAAWVERRLLPGKREGADPDDAGLTNAG